MAKPDIPTLEEKQWVPPRYENTLINTRKDGTKVYMYNMVEQGHWLYPNGHKQYQQDQFKHTWIMPQSTKVVKRRDIHNVIDEMIFEAIDTLKHAKKRVVIKWVREKISESEYKEHLPKNVGMAVSRRIGILLDKRNLEMVKETKHRTVLKPGKYKYIKQ